MTAPYTAAELAAISERVEKATTGQWEKALSLPSGDDYAIIESFRRDVPRLVAELTRAREALRPFVTEFEKHVERYLRRGDRQIMQGNFDRMPDRWSMELDMTMGQCRAARAALGDAFAEATASKEEPADG